ncbi:MAG: S-methyl-5-thioribose-1-phosphate isomerase [Gammaproteobacteria bacterium]|jgi:methylthioribose-1-phosphate isomerase
MGLSTSEHVWQPVMAADWQDEACVLLDQRLLPGEERYLSLRSAGEVADAIREMVVRGAPAIGIAAAYGAVLAYRRAGDDGALLEEGLGTLAAARPTAANLAWAIDRVRRAAGAAGRDAWRTALEEAREIHREDVAMNHAMGRLGAALLGGRGAVVTHCNAGALATGGFGTALGVIREAWAAGKIERVYAGETRPWLQGSRLTAWELARDHIPVTVLADSAMAQMFRCRHPSWLIVGADRVAANGDVANKIGTYGLALSARHHGAKVMVVAPTSTVDMNTASGDDIPIEERGSSEIWAATGADTEPAEVAFSNPAFDVTPAALIDALVTEKGVVERPGPEGLAAMMARP